MFCPKCGTSDQAPETYCRNCGVFLPDLEKVKKRETPIEEHLKINSFFTLATAVISVALAVALFIVFISTWTAPFIIYPVFGFLIAITAWQIQTFIRTRILKRQFEKLRPPRLSDIEEITTGQQAILSEGNPELVVPPSVTELTTRNLDKVDRRMSS